MATGYTLYSMQDSGNCYKPRLLMRLLGRPFRLVDTDSRDGSTRTPDFLKLNPNGKVPLLVFPDGRTLSESNAMLLHLSEGTEYLPADAYERALAYQWLFFEQYSHEPYIAVARSWLHIIDGGREKIGAERLADLHRRGHLALAVMEARLSSADWLAGKSYSVADIALYAYTHVAHQGGFDLAPYPGIRTWLDRVAARPGHVDIDWRP
ncbi:MAG: glutathione S-transferase family protein [Bauldia sp.]